MAPPRSGGSKGNAAMASLNKNKKRHGWTAVIWIFGTLFPPLAVAARFGIGKDFWINLPLTIAGYIPGHVHNFYIQNIRNNKTHARTPKWAIRYGLVDTSKIERNARKSEWSHRYNDRDPANEYENRPVEDGQVPDTPRVPPKKSSTSNGAEPLWRPEDEGYYGESSNRRNSRNASNASLDSGSRSTGRWRYPANFDDATEIEPPRKSKSKSKPSSAGKDRWARSEEARLAVADDGSTRKKRRKSTSRTYTDESSSYREGPEDPFAGNYGGSSGTAAAPPASREGIDDLNHEF